jgi:hypothetical protein
VLVIEQYVKSDGSEIRGHTRLPAGARRAAAVLGAIVAKGLGLGNGNSNSNSNSNSMTGIAIRPARLRLPGQRPQSQPTVVHPIRRPESGRPAVPPTPAVSYPLVLPCPGSGR